MKKYDFIHRLYPFLDSTIDGKKELERLAEEYIADKNKSAALVPCTEGNFSKIFLIFNMVTKI